MLALLSARAGWPRPNSRRREAARRCQFNALMACFTLSLFYRRQLLLARMAYGWLATIAGRARYSRLFDGGDGRLLQDADDAAASPQAHDAL